MFYTGQRVVCTRSQLSPGYGFERQPVIGNIYSIRKFGSDENGGWVLLHEIRNSPAWYLEGFVEAVFDVRRFRPLCEPKTDISIFRKALTDDLIGEEA